MLTFKATTPTGWGVNNPLQPTKFPAGEAHINFISHGEDYIPTLAFWQADSATLNDDLVMLGMYADYCRQRGGLAKVFIPYFPGARQDRGIPFGAKVYADLVNSLEFDEVTVFDPHSPVIVELIRNVRVIESTSVVTRSVFGRAEYRDSGWAGIIAPDAGAVHRAQLVADRVNLPLFRATKVRRDRTLSGFECEELPEEGRFLVVDDICDGGGTFRGLAEATGVARDRLALWVSHGVFSGNAHLLQENYAAIHTTDSHMGARRADVRAHVHSILPYFYN